MIDAHAWDIVVQDEDGKWFFWDETWTNRHGPFDSQAEARLALEQYAKELA